MNSIRVLIVDDVPQVRQGLAIVLTLAAKSTRPRIEVIGEAQNGSDAIEQARALRPDVILMDLEMPALDGYEATGQIKAEHPTQRVIILSVHADPEEQEHTRAAGADGFITKGAGYEVLVNTILGRSDPANLSEIKEGDEL